MKKALFSLAIAMALVAGVIAQTGTARRFGLDDFSRVTRVADPRFSPDGKSISVLISKPVLDEDRHAASIYRVDIATEKMELVEPSTRISVSFPRWSPDGKSIAFLATVGTGSEAHPQVFVVPSQGGPDKQLTTAPMGVQQFAWSPDGNTIAFAAADEPEKKPGWERYNDSFEVQLNDNFLTSAAQTPTHVWIVPSAGGPSKRLTSGTWTLPVSRPPGAPSSMITWTPDGTAVVFNRTGGARGAGAGRGQGQQPPGVGPRGGGGGVQAVKISDGTVTPLNVNGNFPVYSLQGDQLLTLGGGGGGGGGGVSVTPVAGGQAKSFGQAIDRGLARALWMPDGKSIIVGGNDSTQVSLWQLPLEGAAKKLDLAGVSPNSSYFVDMAVSKTGAIAFAGSAPMHPAELYYMASPDATPKALTKVNDEIAAIPDGRLLYRLKRHWRDGTTHMIFEPLELVEKLAALVPPPRFNLIRYHGVLAPSAAFRAMVIPESEAEAARSHPACPARDQALAIKTGQEKGKGRCRPRNYAWAELLKRVFSIDVLACPRCGSRMRILCAIHPPDAIRRILDCLGLPSRPPPIAAATPTTAPYSF